MQIKRLSESEIDTVLKKIKPIREQHLILYSYLTFRRGKVIFYGQCIGDQVIGVIGYFKGMPFTAVALYIEQNVELGTLLSFAKRDLNFGDTIIGTTILSEGQMKFLVDHGKVVSQRKNVLMKHMDQHLLIEDKEAKILEHKDLEQINQLAKEVKMVAFSAEEIESMPHVGIFKEDKLVAVAGFHLFDEGLVEIGNIGTIETERGKGYGKIVSSAVTRLGRQKSEDVYLYVFQGNTPAIKLYEVLGYKTVAHCNFVEFSF
jgi:ribosomal protein S18 acetylase RimI-like enzyme